LSNPDGKFARLGMIACFALLLGAAIALAQKTAPISAPGTVKHIRVEDAVFHSPSLGRDMHYLVLLPADYSNGNRVAVLYLLHGLYGDYRNWETRTRLEPSAAGYSFLIVTPDADDSWYTNSATQPADRFEDYIVKDLISEIDKKYRTIAEKRGRAIAGLSMGGYGAIKFALKYPDLFTFAGSLSGAFDAAENLDVLRPDFRPRLLGVFGDPGSRARKDNDVFVLLKNSHEYPYFYLACGTSDFFLKTNRSLAGQFSTHKIPYEYHESPGGHSWEYWDSQLEPLLQAVSHSLEAMPKSK
jgi:putative tributyrin esterase